MKGYSASIICYGSISKPGPNINFGDISTLPFKQLILSKKNRFFHFFIFVGLNKKFTHDLKKKTCRCLVGFFYFSKSFE